jgi:uracil-DNA glycosylase
MDQAVEEIKEGKRSRIAAMAEEASTCVACPLYETRTKVVFGVGNAASPLMIVGEGPGANEDATGLPFVGRAGKLLDECLRDAGMLRQHVYITNTVKCRACIIDGRSVQNRAPTLDEIGTCAPLWLQKQIDVIQPLVILCIGAPSANTIIHPDFRITKERGKWFESRYARYAMAAMHPAFILRQHGETFDSYRQTLVDDMIAAKEKAKQARHEPKPTLF